MTKNKYYMLSVLLALIGGFLFNSTISMPLAISQYPFTDGFESGDFTNWSSTYIQNGVAIVTTINPYEGSYSGKFTVNPIDGYAYSGVRASLAVTQPIIYASAYVMVPAATIMSATSDKLYVILLVSSNGTSLAYAGVTPTGTGGYTWQLMVRSGGTFILQKAGLVNSDVYYYVQIMWSLSTTGSATLYVDENPIVSISSVDTSQFGECNSVRFGIAEKSGSAFAADVYVDYASVDLQLIPPYVPPTQPDSEFDFAYIIISLLQEKMFSLIFISSSCICLILGYRKRS